MTMRDTNHFHTGGARGLIKANTTGTTLPSTGESRAPPLTPKRPVPLAGVAGSGGPLAAACRDGGRRDSCKHLNPQIRNESPRAGRRRNPGRGGGRDESQGDVAGTRRSSKGTERFVRSLDNDPRTSGSGEHHRSAFELLPSAECLRQDGAHPFLIQSKVSKPCLVAARAEAELGEGLRTSVRRVMVHWIFRSDRFRSAFL